MKNKIIIVTLAIFVSLLLPSLSRVVASDRDCPDHGGVDYCDVSSGHFVCKDGTHTAWNKCLYSTEQLLAEINSSKEEYYKNPDGFRERLLQKIVGLINERLSLYKTSYSLHVDGLAEYIYTILPDVK